jgi:hypothetical protein
MFAKAINQSTVPRVVTFPRHLRGYPIRQPRMCMLYPQAQYHPQTIADNRNTTRNTMSAESAFTVKVVDSACQVGCSSRREAPGFALWCFLTIDVAVRWNPGLRTSISWSFAVQLRIASPLLSLLLSEIMWYWEISTDCRRRCCCSRQWVIAVLIAENFGVVNQISAP